jgi:hypothetical protein
MLILPELAVALRRELETILEKCADEAVALSVWSRARPARAESDVVSLRAALARPLTLVLWQKGAWGSATAARERLGGELTCPSDMEPIGQLWLFDSLTIPSPVRQRFALPPDARVAARLLLPLPEGMALGFLLRSPEGIPFLRLLPDLYPGEFLADPHLNFVAARRCAAERATDVTPPGAKSRGETVLSVDG